MQALRSALLALVVPFALLLLPAAPASAETLTCTNVTVLPTTISAAGLYCLNADFSAAYVASPVTINGSNVVLDCNDHTITNSGAGAPNGITVNNQSQVTVRNCNLNGFGRGITYYETVLNTSRNNRIERNDVRRSKTAGIQVGGTANVIEGNRVSENVGPPTGPTYGILVQSAGNAGVGNVVRNNTVTNIAPATAVPIYGIYLLDVDNTAVIGNTVSALFPPSGQTANGIWGGLNALGNAAVGNTVMAATGPPPGGGGGLVYDGTDLNGIRFTADPDTVNRNACRNNVVGHFNVDILGETATNGCVKDANTEF
jgi:parallel beta-helix repeat protein